MLTLGISIFLIFLYSSSALWRFYLYHPILRKNEDDNWQAPLLSIIFAAKDEEKNIEKCVRSLLHANYPNLEVIAINDRSQDQTGNILEKIKKEDPRLKILHIKNLPNNWLGKCHALHIGAQKASGDYLLFTDADIIFSPSVLSMSVYSMQKNQWQHLSLLPHMTTENSLECAITSFFGMSYLIGTRAHLISTSSKTSYAGVGAFNMVEKKSYFSTGGHEKLRLTIVDDVYLGRIMKDHGFSSALIPAPEHLQVKWQQGTLGLIKGLEKNAFAALNFSWAFLIFIFALFILGHILPYIALFNLNHSWSWPFALISPLVLFSFYKNSIKMGYSQKQSLKNILWGPVPSIIYLWIIFRSALITEYQGGIHWRETFYSKKILKNQSYPRS